MAVAGTRQARLIVAVRLGLLSLGAIVLILPFVYMLLTSFKPNTLVLEIPPQFFPHHSDDGELHGRLDVEPVRPLLPQLGDRRRADDGGRRAALGDDGLLVRPLPLSGPDVLFGLVLIALMVPTMMMLIPQFLLAKQLLLLNSLWGLVVFYTGGNLALNTFLLRSFFQDIPVELEEAMVVDGAGPWTRFWRLILPLSRPALAVVGIFTFLASWDEFTWALTIINDPGKYTLPIAISLFQGQHSTSWGLVFAASAIMIAPVIAIFAIFQRQFVAGIAAGAVKA